jgi:gliding motility-associated-like protein
LHPGTYHIELTDAFSCSIDFDIVVDPAISETLDLGPDRTILVGDSLRINPNLSFVPDSFYWTGDISLLDLLQLSNEIRPTVDQHFTLFGIDSKGCLYSDELNIKVLLTSVVYVPTVFSPNDDGVNDVIGPLGDPSITHFDYFEVFSRWGELVFSKKDFLPGDNVGWDGKFNGKQLQPGVFVYRLSAMNKKGKEIAQYGDFTLVR